MSRHEDFINTSIETILYDAILAVAAIGKGIETYPLNEYMMKTLFLQMTGFQEQKFKCIAWEIATEDYEFRRGFLESFSKTGFSSYKDKRNLYKEIMGLIKKEELSEEERKRIAHESRESMMTIFGKSILKTWNTSAFHEFTQKIENEIKYDKFAVKGSGYVLFENTVKEIYEKLYHHRNRLAHNTTSYQRNLPTLDTLENLKFGEGNYFVWFYLLVVIDKVIIYLYKEYKNNSVDIFGI